MSPIPLKLRRIGPNRYKAMVQNFAHITEPRTTLRPKLGPLFKELRLVYIAIDNL